MLRGGSRDGSSTDGARMMQIYAAPAAPAKYDRRMAATMATTAMVAVAVEWARSATRTSPGWCRSLRCLGHER